MSRIGWDSWGYGYERHPDDGRVHDDHELSRGDESQRQPSPVAGPVRGSCGGRLGSLLSVESGAVMLPMLGVAVLYFRYRRLDPRLRPGRLWDAFLWLSCVGFLLVGAWAVAGLVR